MIPSEHDRFNDDFLVRDLEETKCLKSKKCRDCAHCYIFAEKEIGFCDEFK